MRFSDSLTNELIVGRMVRALRKVEDLRTSARLVAYANAGIPTEQIRDFDDKAWATEERRRKAFAKCKAVAGEALDTAATFVVFGVIFTTMFLAFAPDRAFAMESREIAAWAFAGAFGFVALAVILLAILLVVIRLVRAPADEDHDAFGDTTGYQPPSKGKL